MQMNCHKCCFSYVVFQYIYSEASRRSKESQAHHLHFKEILLLRRIWFLTQGSFLFIFFWGARILKLGVVTLGLGREEVFL